MPYRITYLRSAVKALRKIDRQDARRILLAIDKLAYEPRPQGSVQLKDGAGEMRIRVGAYRVIYDVLDAEVVILVLRIGHRRDIYRNR